MLKSKVIIPKDISNLTVSKGLRSVGNPLVMTGLLINPLC